jgi:hypothetical protein
MWSLQERWSVLSGEDSRDLEMCRTVDTDMQEITIRMFNGEKPATNSLAYDARELLKALPLKNNALAAALTDRKH